MQVEIAVVECGVGGKLDATNMFDEGQLELSIITPIGWDHQGLLGESIELNLNLILILLFSSMHTQEGPVWKKQLCLQTKKYMRHRVCFDIEHIMV